MNKLLTAIFLAGILIFGTASGCKTSPEDIAYKTVGTINITASSAMEGWLDYKNSRTNVPPAQIAAVKAAWDKFYAANQAAKVAIVAFKTNTDTNALNKSIAVVSAAQAEVIGLVLQFLPASKAAALKGVK